MRIPHLPKTAYGVSSSARQIEFLPVFQGNETFDVYTVIPTELLHTCQLPILTLIVCQVTDIPYPFLDTYLPTVRKGYLYIHLGTPRIEINQLSLKCGPNHTARSQTNNFSFSLVPVRTN